MNKSLCKKSNILALDNSIRFVALSNNLGTIDLRISNWFTTFNDDGRNKQYAIQTVTRAALTDNFTSKLGQFEYPIGKYSKLLRAVIPTEKRE